MTDTIQLTNEKPPVYSAFTRNIKVAMSGKKPQGDVNKMPTNQEGHLGLNAKSFAGLPQGYNFGAANRIFGLFPFAQGSQMTNKKERHNLAKIGVFSAAINDQEQNTEIEVMGKNVQLAYTVPERFANYEGNAKGGASRVKHATKSILSNISTTIAKMLNGSQSNPVIKEVLK